MPSEQRGTVWLVSQDDMSDDGVSDPARDRLLGVFSSRSAAEQFVVDRCLPSDLTAYIDEYELGDVQWATEFDVYDPEDEP